MKSYMGSSLVPALWPWATLRGQRSTGIITFALSGIERSKLKSLTFLMVKDLYIMHIFAANILICTAVWVAKFAPQVDAQNNVVQIVTGAPHRDHITPVLPLHPVAVLADSHLQINSQCTSSQLLGRFAQAICTAKVSSFSRKRSSWCPEVVQDCRSLSLCLLTHGL